MLVSFGRVSMERSIETQVPNAAMSRRTRACSAASKTYGYEIKLDRFGTRGRRLDVTHIAKGLFQTREQLRRGATLKDFADKSTPRLQDLLGKFQRSFEQCRGSQMIG